MCVNKKKLSPQWRFSLWEPALFSLFLSFGSKQNYDSPNETLLRSHTLGCPGWARRPVTVAINGTDTYIQGFTGEELNLLSWGLVRLLKPTLYQLSLAASLTRNYELFAHIFLNINAKWITSYKEVSWYVVKCEDSKKLTLVSIAMEHVKRWLSTCLYTTMVVLSNFNIQHLFCPFVYPKYLSERLTWAGRNRSRPIGVYFALGPWRPLELESPGTGKGDPRPVTGVVGSDD